MGHQEQGMGARHSLCSGPSWKAVEKLKYVHKYNNVFKVTTA